MPLPCFNLEWYAIRWVWNIVYSIHQKQGFDTAPPTAFRVPFRRHTGRRRLPSQLAGHSQTGSDGKKLRCMFVANVSAGSAFVTNQGSLPSNMCPPPNYDSVVRNASGRMLSFIAASDDPSEPKCFRFCTGMHLKPCHITLCRCSAIAASTCVQHPLSFSISHREGLECERVTKVKSIRRITC